MKLLMHTCCAPCSIYCISSLREEGIEPTIYWYNPNIHPYTEYRLRRDTLKDYTKSINIQAIFEEEYGLETFCTKVIDDLKNRCENYCYRVRLEQTARYAKEKGYDTITTTLLVSPYQKHECLKQQAYEIAKQYGLTFLYRDFRIGFREGQQKARELGLYRQKYCGCIFSEEMSSLARQEKDKEMTDRANRDTERRIRLGRLVPNLYLVPHKNGNRDEIQFIYNLKKEVYQKYVEKYFKEWNEESQKKLFERFMKENSKNIELIYLREELVGFYNGKDKDDNTFEIGNICIKPEYQNKGIGTAILKEILFEHKEQNIKLQVFKENPAIRLYQKLGFEIEKETNTHYFMKKNLE